jgi:hypothetical protein
MPTKPVGDTGARTSLHLVEPAQAFAGGEDAEPAPEVVAMVDPGPVLRGEVALQADLAQPDSVAWIEYHAAPSGSREWQAIARSSAAPFNALVDTTALRDGDYDLRIFAARRDGAIDGSRPLRGRTVMNAPPTVLLLQPQVGMVAAGTVPLQARIAPACARLQSLGFEFSSDGERWWPMLRARRTGPGTALWYTVGLRDGEYLLRAVATFARGARVTSAAAEVRLAAPPPSAASRATGSPGLGSVVPH